MLKKPSGVKITGNSPLEFTDFDVFLAHSKFLFILKNDLSNSDSDNIVRDEHPFQTFNISSPRIKLALA